MYLYVAKSFFLLLSFFLFLFAVPFISFMFV